MPPIGDTDKSAKTDGEEFRWYTTVRPVLPDSLEAVELVRTCRMGLALASGVVGLSDGVEGRDVEMIVVEMSMPSRAAVANSSFSISSSVREVGCLRTDRTYSASLSSGGRVTASEGLFPGEKDVRASEPMVLLSRRREAGCDVERRRLEMAKVGRWLKAEAD